MNIKEQKQNKWDSTIIDKFSTIPPEIDYYQKSCDLNNCIRLYSTRVDDLCLNTQKLLKILEIKKKPKKIKNTLDSEDKISLKPIPNFVDFFLKVKKLRDIGEKQDFLLNSSVDVYDYQLQLFENNNDIEFNDDKNIKKFDDYISNDLNKSMFFISDENLEGYQNEKFLCPSLCKTDIETEVNPNDTLNNIEFEIEDNNLEKNYEINCNEIDETKLNEKFLDENQNLFEIKNENVKFNNPFFSWTGAVKKKNKIKNKNKQKKDINFDIEIKKFEVGDTLFTPEFIKNRRIDKKILPNDYQLGRNDLFRFLLRDGCFKCDIKHNFNECELSINLENQRDYNNEDLKEIEIKEEVGREIEIEKENDDYNDIGKENDIIQNKEENILKRHKKVDIKRLKTNIKEIIKSGVKEFNKIYKNIPKKYTKNESDDISIQTCFISLLHLANEENLILKNENGKLNVEY